MRFDGITCCVGEKYAAQLAKSLVTWLSTLDSLTIVTDDRDTSVRAMVGDIRRSHSEIRSKSVAVIRSQRFYEHGATFNKAAALCDAYAVADPSDWVVHFDSDIIPPVYWRKLAESRIESGNLYGAFRYSEDGKRLDEYPLFPYGYLHVWNVNDPCAWRWPIFETWHPHAGNYDSNFAEQWPRQNRRDLGFGVFHQGEPRQNWNGPSGKSMNDLHAVGLAAVRRNANAGRGIIYPPEPLVRLWMLEGETNPEWAKAVLRLAMSKGFAVSVAPTMTTMDRLLKKTSADFRVIFPTDTVDSIKAILDAEVHNLLQCSYLSPAPSEALQSAEYPHSS